jgi:predicted PurR-regulated permease PerM
VYVEKPGNGLATAALVLGIVGVVFGLIPLTFFIALICGVLALIFGVIGWRAANKGRGRKGLAVSGTVLGVVALLLAFAGIFIIGEAADDLQNELDQINQDLEEDLENLED